MSGGKYIKQAIIAALCEHPDKDKYSARAFSGEGLNKTVDALSNTAHQLTKADFLSPDETRPLRWRRPAWSAADA